MKKIFSYLAAAAMLFAASCSNEDLGTNDANETQVTFNLSLEGQSGTRATIGDGAGVTKLSYYIFDVQTGERLNHYDYENQTFSTVTPKIQLAKDQRYKAVFWAQKETSAYTIEEVGDKGTVNIKVNYAENANDEARDAFYGVVEFTVTGSERIDVLLKRPFAQLNVGVTKDDYNAAVASGVTIKKSWAKVEDVYNTLNLLTGEATGEVDAEFTLAQRPGQTLDVELNGNEGIQDDEKFQYLSMNYILAGDRKNVKASFRFENEDGSKKINFNSGLDAVPVERNYRTNLVGQILTGNLDFNVSIDKNFKGDHNISGIVSISDKNQEAFETALKNPEVHTIILGEGTFIADIYNETPGRKSLTIIGTEGTKFGHKATTGGQLRLELFENFTIKNCEIIQRSGYKTWGHLVFGSGNKANGVYTIENCTFNSVGNQGIYINENTSGATYNIVNCTFNGDFGSEGAITIQTNKDVNHTVNVKGCTFNTTSHKIFLASYDKQGSFYYGWNLNTDLKASTAYEIDMFAKLGKPIYVTSADQLNAALANADVKTVYLNAGKYTLPSSSIKEGQTIICEEGTVFTGKSNLNIKGATIIGATFEGTDNQVVNSSTINGIFKDCKFVGDLYYCYAGKNVVFENCEFNGPDYALHFDGGSNSVTLKNCVINSKRRVAIGAAVTLFKAENCKFNAEGFVNVYCNSIFTNCEFNTPRLSPLGGKLEFNNCKYEDSNLVFENLKTYNGYNCIVCIDGTQYEVK